MNSADCQIMSGAAYTPTVTAVSPTSITEPNSEITITGAYVRVRTCVHAYTLPLQTQLAAVLVEYYTLMHTMVLRYRHAV